MPVARSLPQAPRSVGNPSRGRFTMIPIRRVLCPLDFSRFSRHALEQAIALARESGAVVSALHVFSLAPVAEVVMAGVPTPIDPVHRTAPERAALLSELREFTGQVD